MSNRPIVRLLALVGTALVMTAPLAADDEGFRPLFPDGSLKEWEVVSASPLPEDHWTLRDGVLSAKAGTSWLRSKATYRDFVLRLEWRVPQDGNSGVFLRVPPLKDGEHPWVQGVEIQILDDLGPKYADKLQPYQYTGSVYGAAAAQRGVYQGPGIWHRYEITCRGPLLQVVLNGRKVVEANYDELPALKGRPREGAIGLQNHGTPVEFRNLSIRVLE